MRSRLASPSKPEKRDVNLRVLFDAGRERAAAPGLDSRPRASLSPGRTNPADGFKVDCTISVPRKTSTAWSRGPTRADWPRRRCVFQWLGGAVQLPVGARSVGPIATR